MNKAVEHLPVIALLVSVETNWVKDPIATLGSNGLL